MEFTIKQAQQAAIDGINADLYKEELDSTNIIVIEYKKLTKQQMYEIRQLGFDRNIRDDIITGFKTESGKYKTWWEDSEAKLHLTKTVDKVVYPILGGGILATILYITLSSVIHK